MSDGWMLVLAVVCGAMAATGVLGWFSGRASTAGERRRLHAQAHRDPLTGLLNRAGLAEAASAVVKAGGAGQTAAMLVDLVGFKQVNDTHGHAAGDAVLAEVARTLQQCVRPWGGVVARVGGDEFAVLLPVCRREDEVVDATSAVVRCLTGTYAVVVGLEWQQVAVGATVGVGTACPAAAIDADRLLRVADAAMYAARRSGRNWSIRSAGVDPDPAGPGTVSMTGRRGSHDPERAGGPDAESSRRRGAAAGHRSRTPRGGPLSASDGRSSLMGRSGVCGLQLSRWAGASGGLSGLVLQGTPGSGPSKASAHGRGRR